MISMLVDLLLREYDNIKEIYSEATEVKLGDTNFLCPGLIMRMKKKPLLRLRSLIVKW